LKKNDSEKKWKVNQFTTLLANKSPAVITKE